MSIATRTGDDGTTALMYGRRVGKADARVEAYGTVDELNAALGMARAHAELPLAREELLAVQRQLVSLMGELAVAPLDRERYRAEPRYPKLEAASLAHLDALVEKIESEKFTLDGWATPGASLASGALDVARTVCRRAERRVAVMMTEEDDGLALRYLNRLSDVLWLLARYTENLAKK